MCVTAQRWEHPLLSDTQRSPRQSPVSSCNIPANGTSTRGAAGGIRQTGQIREGHGVEGPGSPATRPGAFLFATSLESRLPVFQLAEAIQRLRMMLCDGSLVALRWVFGGSGGVECSRSLLSGKCSAVFHRHGGKRARVLQLNPACFVLRPT